MSAFLDEVFAAQQARHRPPRRTGQGLSGSGKSFATLLTLMVGLTAVPTFIMVRAGVEELRSPSAAPIHPILLEVPDKPPPANKQPLVIESQPNRSNPVTTPPEPVVPQREPILERKAVVDTSPRPVARKHKTAKQSAPTPAEPSSSDTVEPEPKQRRHKRHHKDGGRMERPVVVKPDVVRPEVVRPEVVRPEAVRPHRDRAERARS